MEDLGSVWMTYQESVDDLRHKLLCSTVELESVKMEAMEQMRKNEENVKSLIQLINMANRERDEAKEQLQKILTKINLIPSYNLTHNHNLSPETPLLFSANMTNSGVTESESLDDSLFDAAATAAVVSSPDSSADVGFRRVDADPADAVIDSLAAKRSLPQKGRLLRSVMEAGPLLSTLLVAGPLPQWRNPPPIQPFSIPAVAIHGADPAESSRPYSTRSCSASMLSFGGAASGSPMVNNDSRVLSMSSSFNDRFSMAKRQRLY